MFLLNEKLSVIPLPSGRYRTDAIVTEAERNNIILDTQFYFSISDNNRIEQY